MIVICNLVARMRFVALPSSVANDAHDNQPESGHNLECAVDSVGRRKWIVNEKNRTLFHPSFICLHSSLEKWRSELENKWNKKYPLSLTLPLCGCCLMDLSVGFIVSSLRSKYSEWIFNLPMPAAKRWRSCSILPARANWRITIQQRSSSSRTHTLSRWKYASEWIIYNGIHNKWMRNGWIRTETKTMKIATCVRICTRSTMTPHRIQSAKYAEFKFNFNGIRRHR